MNTESLLKAVSRGKTVGNGRRLELYLAEYGLEDDIPGLAVKEYYEVLVGKVRVVEEQDDEFGKRVVLEPEEVPTLLVHHTVDTTGAPEEIRQQDCYYYSDGKEWRVRCRKPNTYCSERGW